MDTSMMDAMLTKANTTKRPNYRQLTWTKEMMEQIPVLRAQGLNVTVLVERLGVSPQAFRRMRQRTGLILDKLAKQQYNKSLTA